MGQWAGDGLLAIFFFVAGLELKREFVAGDLRDPRRATLPIVSAIAAMTLPALLFVALSVSGGFAVPLFAFSPPASPSGPGRSGRVPRGPRTLGIIAGLVAGKSVGILGATYLVARFTRASLDDDLPWVDVLDLAILGAWGSPCRSSSASSPSPRAANSTST